MPIHPKETHVTLEAETLRTWIHRLRLIRNTIKLYPDLKPGSEPTQQILKDVAWLTLSIDKALHVDLFDEIRAKLKADRLKTRLSKKAKGTL